MTPCDWLDCIGYTFVGFLPGIFFGAWLMYVAKPYNYTGKNDE